MIIRPSPGLLVPSLKPGLKAWLSSCDIANDGSQQTNNTGVNPWISKDTGILFNQGTGANQPLVLTNQLNGRPIIRFDGVNDCLISNSATLALSNPFSIFALVKLSNSANTLQTIMSRGPVGTPFLELMINRVSANGAISFFDGANWQDSSAAIVTTTAYNFVGWTWDGTNAKTYINGGSPTVPTGIRQNPPTTAGNFVIGGQGATSTTNFFSGDIPVVNLYSALLSPADVVDLTRDVANFFGLNF